ASVRFDLEVAGDLATLQGTLLKHGWRAQTAADWVTALRLLDDSTPAAERPVLPVALSAHPERLLLRRTSSDPARIEVLRVWPAPVRLADGTPLWVARYERMQLHHRLRLLSLWTPDPPAHVLPEDLQALPDAAPLQVRVHPR
ncbi:MAG TPA: LssY C-terminal domain-containing protein, partial [Thermomonas sp.]|nr:LssY C-terminal domain-containing protein [Thermomonas sp.]